jgi:acyl-CoA thioesterase-2
MDSPNSSGSRGFARGHFFREDGTLVASCAQEGLVRVLSDEDADRRRSDPKQQT